MVRMLTAIGTTGLFLVMAAPGRCGEIVLPQDRSAYYADEAIELAVAGLARGQAATVAMVPRGKAPGLASREVRVEGDGSTVVVELPPLYLAPGTYEVVLDGKPAGRPLIVSSGVNDSTMLITQTIEAERVRATGGNFLLTNAFAFGLVGPDGLPAKDPRGRSGGLETLRAGGGRSTCRRSFTCTGPAT